MPDRFTVKRKALVALVLFFGLSLFFAGYSIIAPTSLNLDRTPGWAPAALPLSVSIEVDTAADVHAGSLRLIRTTPRNETTDIQPEISENRVVFTVRNNYVRDLSLEIPEGLREHITELRFSNGQTSRVFGEINPLFLERANGTYALNPEIVDRGTSHSELLSGLINYRGDYALAQVSALSAFLIVTSLFFPLKRIGRRSTHSSKWPYILLFAGLGIWIATRVFLTLSVQVTQLWVGYSLFWCAAIVSLRGIIASGEFPSASRKLFYLTLLLILSIELATMHPLFGSLTDGDSLSIVAPAAFLLLATGVHLAFGYREISKQAGGTSVFFDRLATVNRRTLVYILVALTFLSAVLRFGGIGSEDFHDDEFLGMSTAVGYTETGDYVRWQWSTDGPGSEYDRAWPHTWLIAQSINLFGLSEASARFPSALLGMFFVLLLYPITKSLTAHRGYAMAVVAIAAISPFYIDMAQWVRMYAILLPSFLILAWTSYRTIAYQPPPLPGQIPYPVKYVRSIPIHFGFAVLSLILLWLNYELHINSLIIGPAILLFLAIAHKLYDDLPVVRRYVAFASIVLLSLFAIILFTDLFPHENHATFFGRRNYEYIGHVFRPPFPGITGLIFTVISTVIAVKRKWTGITFAGILTLFTLIFFVYIGDRYDAAKYSSHATVFGIIASTVGFAAILRLFDRRKQLILLVATCAVFATHVTTNLIDRYTTPNNPQHLAVYESISDDYDPDRDALHVLASRGYYITQAGISDWETLPRKGGFSLSDLEEVIHSNERGWFVWETGKDFHFDSEVVSYMERNLEKVHGEGVDKKKLEVYHFTQNE